MRHHEVVLGSPKPVVERLSLNVQPAQKSGQDPSLSHPSNAWQRHDQLAVEVPNGFVSGCGEDKVGFTVQSSRVFLGPKVESAGAC